MGKRKTETAGKIFKKSLRAVKRLKNTLFIRTVALICLCALFFCGCSRVSALTDGAEESGTPMPSLLQTDDFDFRSSLWPGDIRIICGSAPYPSGKLKSSKADAADACTAEFTDVGFAQFAEWLGKITGARWALGPQGAKKGPRDMEIRYQNNNLTVKITNKGPEGEWPGNLPAELAAAAPYFSYGKIDKVYTRQLELCREAYTCVFNRVSSEDVLQYENSLLDNGYTYKGNKNGRRYFEKGNFIVGPNLNIQNGSFSIVIGVYNAKSEAAAAPWPQNLPQNYRNALPEVIAEAGVAAALGGYEITLKNLALTGLADWYKALKIKGWQDAAGTLVNPQAALVMQAKDCNTDTNTWVFDVAPKTGEAALPQPSEGEKAGFDDGLKDYDFALTKQAYTPSDIEKGIQKEFGKDAEAADWKELKQRYTKIAEAFLDACGTQQGEKIWVVSGGKAYSKKGQHYFLLRAQNADGLKTLDTLGTNSAFLGAEKGQKLHALVKVPVKTKP